MNKALDWLQGMLKWPLRILAAIGMMFTLKFLLLILDFIRGMSPQGEEFCQTGLVILVTLVPPVLLTWMHQRRLLPRYEEWRKTALEMGLEVPSNPKRPTVAGDYRNHHIEICQVGDGEDEVIRTLYVVQFKNPKGFWMYLKKRGGLSMVKHWMERGEPEFVEAFEIKVSESAFNEAIDIRQIFDSSIRARIMSVRNTIYELYIGTSPIRNGLCYLDSQSLSETKENAGRFRLIVETLIDIVEKMETYTPS